MTRLSPRFQEQIKTERIAPERRLGAFHRVTTALAPPGYVGDSQMKKLIAATAAAALGLTVAACNNSPAEKAQDSAVDAQKDAADAQEAASDAKADSIRDTTKDTPQEDAGEAKADSIEKAADSKSDAMKARADSSGDAMKAHADSAADKK